MASKIHTITIQLAIVSLLCISPPTKASIVEKTCEGNQECLEILGKDPRAAAAKDVMELSKIALEMAIKNSAEGGKFVQDLADKEADPVHKELLNNVAKGFTFANSQFVKANGELASNAESASKDAMEAFDQVRDGLENLNKKGFKDPTVRPKVNDIFKYALVTSSLIGELEA